MSPSAGIGVMVNILIGRSSPHMHNTKWSQTRQSIPFDLVLESHTVVGRGINLEAHDLQH